MRLSGFPGRHRLLGLMLLALIVVSCSPDVRFEDVFQRYVEAVNRNDVGGALAVHAPDAEFVIPGRPPVRGTGAIRSLLQWDSVMESQIHFGGVDRIGDTLIAGLGTERSLWFAGIGLDSIAYDGGTRVVFEGGLIKGVYPASLIPESAAAFRLRFAEFLAWATQNAPAQLNDLMLGGLFDYGPESAEAWLQILQRYGTTRIP